MNILYMHTHDSGRFFDPYGHRIGTPAIQSLAVEGTLFRSAFSAAPTCSPSRAALLTGMNPHSSGMLGLAHRGFSLRDYQNHLVHQLNNEGFDTVLCGIQHVAGKAEDIGYGTRLDSHQFEMSHDYNFDTIDFDKRNAREVADYILHRAEINTPFFLSFGMFNTHRIYPPVAEDVDPDDVELPPGIADTRENRQDFAGHVTSARAVDDCVNVVIEALNSSGFRDDTIIIFTTDHGIPLPEMKCTLYDSGIGVTLIVDYPGNPLKGMSIDALVSHLDIYPTICELVGIAKPDWLEGVPLTPLFDGAADEVRDEIHAEVTYHAAYEPMRCVRTKRYKLIRRFDPPYPVVKANIDDCNAKSLMIDAGFASEPRDEFQLFDLATDPGERNNLTGDPEYGPILEDLKSRLSKWMDSTGDPLMKGEVPLPKGAFANLRTSYSANEDQFEYET